MKTFFLSVLTAASLCGIGYFSIDNAGPASHQEGGATTESFGLKPGGRKEFEFNRLKNPATGMIPKNMRQNVMEFAKRLPVKAEDRNQTWTARGPINKGGRSRATALDGLDENIILAGSVSGGMWRSTNGGQTWTKTTAPHQIHSTSCVIQDIRPGKENIWYMGTGEEGYGIVSATSFTSLFSGDGIFKSTDGGQSWFQLESTASNTPQNTLQNGSYDFAWNMAMDYSNLEEDEVYAAVYNGIIRSVDGGETWTQVLGFEQSGSRNADVIVNENGVVYAYLSFANAISPGGVWRSTDGINWTNITPAGFTGQQRGVMCINPLNQDEMFMIAERQNQENNIGYVLHKYSYVSGDGSGAGGVWSDRSANVPDDPCQLQIGTLFDFGTFRSQNGFDLCITHHPTEPVLFIGGVNIHRSFSEFAQDDHDWIGGYRCNIENPLNYSYPNNHSDQHLFVFSRNNPNVMYNANDGGIYRTDDVLADSVAWVPLNNGYLTTQFYTVAMEQGWADSDFVFGGMQDNGTWITHSDNPQTNWKEVHADDGAFCALPQGRNFILTSSQLGRIYKKTIDAEGNLTGTERIDPTSGPSYLFINPFILDSQTHNDIWMAGNRTIWHLEDVNSIEVTNDYITRHPLGEWDNVSESIIPVSAGAITTLDQAIIDNSTLFYGSSNGRIWKLENIHSDSPVRTELNSDIFPEDAYTSCIAVNDLDTQELLVSFSNYSVQSIFHSTDGGESFVSISGNLEQNPDGSGNGPAVYWMEVYPSDPAIYFAGTSAGLFSTTELNGENTIWEMEGPTTIGNVVINMIKARPYDGTIAIATHGNGIYSASLPPIEAANVQALATFSRDVKVYPNPFTDYVEWNYATKIPLESILKVYDTRGNEVYNTGYIKQVPGNQSLRWNPRADLPRGTYVYMIRVGGVMKTGKIIHQ